MSWIAIILHLPEGAEAFSDLPPGYTPPPLGTRAELIARFRERFASVKVASERGPFEIDGNIVYMGQDDVVTVISIRNPAEELLDFIVQHTDWKIMSAERGTRVRWPAHNENEQPPELPSSE